MAAFADSSVLADHPTQALEFAGELRVQADNLVEGLHDMGIDTVKIFRQEN